HHVVPDFKLCFTGCAVIF
ncbi:hypothetical protein BKD11_08290, partial [Vibrio parahaemolyticus]